MRYDQYDIKQILHEMRTYNPKADEYGGKHIIPGWADRIEVAISRMKLVDEVEIPDELMEVRG